MSRPNQDFRLRDCAPSFRVGGCRYLLGAPLIVLMAVTAHAEPGGVGALRGMAQRRKMPAAYPTSA